MAVLIDDDFQSYTVGGSTPYGPYASGGSLAAIGVVPTSIINTPAGIFGDVKSVFAPALRCMQFPKATVVLTDPYYQQFTAYWGFAITSSNGLEENGAVMQFINGNQPFNSAAIATLKVLADGCLAFTSEDETVFYATSDYSLLVNKWYFFRVDISFSILGNGNFGYTATWYADGIARVAVVNLDTHISAAAYTIYVYVNGIIVGGAGGGSTIGRMTVYDTIQAAGFYPHPGSPSALITQGAIELITSSVPGPPTPPFPPIPPPGPPTPPVPGGCAGQSTLIVAPGLSVAGAAPPSIPGQTNSLKSQL